MMFDGLILQLQEWVGAGNLRTENIIKFSKKHKITKKFLNSLSFFQALKKKI